MIVVAIIGILAAVAVPQFKDYVGRAKWADLNTRIAPLKTAIASCTQQNNGVLELCDTGGSASSKLGSELGYVSLPTATNATITLTPGTAAIVVAGDSSMSGCVVTWTPSVDSTKVGWTAATSGAGCNKHKTGV